jgi:hypothetical protein
LARRKDSLGKIGFPSPIDFFTQKLIASLHIKPNIILVIVSDLECGDLGFYRVDKTAKPNTDLIAGESTLPLHRENWILIELEILFVILGSAYNKKKYMHSRIFFVVAGHLKIFICFDT